MLRMIFAVVVALAVSVFHLRSAEANETPWCAVISEGHWDCQYRSIEECRPNVLAGNRGWCNPNPYFIAPYRPTEYRHYRMRHARRLRGIG
jgi:uncharacterized protein DUF3551